MLNIIKRSVSMRLTVTAVTAGLLLAGCSLDKMVNVDDPEGGSIVDIDNLRSQSGGITVYNGSMSLLASGMNSLISDVGFFTDELQALRTVSGAVVGSVMIDARRTRYDKNIRLFLGAFHPDLNRARNQAIQSREILRQWGSGENNFYNSASYAVEGTAILHLAETMCAGQTLSYLPFEGNPQFLPQLTTSELFEAALARFDSSQMYSHDSTGILTLARVGRGRALLALGRFEEAKAAVASVAMGDSAVLTYTEAQAGAGGSWNQSLDIGGTSNTHALGNMEGGAGLMWIASVPSMQDPRVPVRRVGATAYQWKYPSKTARVGVATWIHAKMIEAEANLHNYASLGEDWIIPLNEARSSIGMPPLSDTSAASVRVDLLFSERAKWLFLTGSRLGDYRRLINQFGRTKLDVYPSGFFDRGDPSLTTYGDAYVFTPNMGEIDLSPTYGGCTSYEP